MVWMMLLFLTASVIFAFHIIKSYHFSKEVNPNRKILVVTGCDSGIGHALALTARKWGCIVVGTCLEPNGKAGDTLRAAGIHVVRLDLMEKNASKELLKIIEQLEAQGDKLWCLVNNSGVLTIASCEWQTEHIVNQQIQVNLCGAIQVTSRLLPRIRRNKGRIVLVSSPTGQVACPGMSVYCASKFGIEAFAQGLRREVQHLGVQVTVVRPCNLPNQTQLLRDNARRLREMREKASDETTQDFGSLMKQTENLFARNFTIKQENQDIKDNMLLRCFRFAILSEYPEAVYAAAPLAVRWYLSLAQVLPTVAVDFLVLHGYHDKIMALALIP